MTVTAPAHPARASSAVVRAIPAEKGATVLCLRGAADLATTMVLTDSLARDVADLPGAVVLDLAGDNFVDTLAVRAIAGAGHTLGKQDRCLSVRSPTGLVRLMLANLDSAHLVEGRVER